MAILKPGSVPLESSKPTVLEQLFPPRQVIAAQLVEDQEDCKSGATIGRGRLFLSRTRRDQHRRQGQNEGSDHAEASAGRTHDRSPPGAGRGQTALVILGSLSQVSPKTQSQQLSEVRGFLEHADLRTAWL